MGVCFSKLQDVGEFSCFPSKSMIPHKQYRIRYVVFLFFVFFSYYNRTIFLRGPAIDLQDERGAWVYGRNGCTGMTGRYKRVLEFSLCFARM